MQNCVWENASILVVLKKISKNLEKCLPSIYGDGWMALLPILVALSSTKETIFQTMLDFQILIMLQNQN